MSKSPYSGFISICSAWEFTKTFYLSFIYLRICSSVSLYCKQRNKTTPSIIHISNWSNVTRWDRIKPEIRLKWCKVNESAPTLHYSKYTRRTVARDRLSHCTSVWNANFVFWWVGKCQIRIGLQHFGFIHWAQCVSQNSVIKWERKKQKNKEEESNRLFNIIEIHLVFIVFAIDPLGKMDIYAHCCRLFAFVFPYFFFHRLCELLVVLF